jgi:hypothetical protein
VCRVVKDSSRLTLKPHFGKFFDNKRSKIAAKSLVLKDFSYKSFKLKDLAGISL